MLVATLSGCSMLTTLTDAYLMKYDANEYKIITEIRADAQAYKKACSNELMSTPNAVAMAEKTNLFVLYTQYLPHNEPAKKASIELDKIAQGLKDQYVNSSKVSSVFCKIKFETIEHSAESIQKMTGAKPR